MSKAFSNASGDKLKESIAKLHIQKSIENWIPYLKNKPIFEHFPLLCENTVEVMAITWVIMP